ncbi:uncharacterized protein [Blastocystis hominis]|uniref:Nudix hydrolase domain-containing protein n=1 Tax=Blastocystis hominis TaxID=12968 RepID=D8LY21_BLAHO|nr:uncharacterized protein [Blastocystis hominis]CBK20476.2 unnamed protein product [Blastocystis hominis]|eukprot:XP_012894524.1 uncharacterized protein [Blastocystis hominis]
MSGITEVHQKSIAESKYIKLNNVEFMENGIKRSWDYVTSMDSVSAFVYDKINREFIIIRQFRPPLRFGASELTMQSTSIDTLGYCYELCAGLMDVENRSKEQAVVDEIREELGNVGMTGSRGYLFYVEVTPEQKKYPGGGLQSEGEQIEIVHLKEKDVDSFLMDGTKEKSAGLFVAFYWWKNLRAKCSVYSQTLC